MVCFKILSQYLPGGTEENHENSVRIDSLQADIHIWDLLNMRQEY
jgi:hypothetical protein